MSQKRTIVLTGGGSGGHITPLLAIAAELKHRQPKSRIVYIGQKGDHLLDIPADDPHIDAVRAVRAGKFRRYHGEGWRWLLDLPTMLLNIRDFFYVLIGIFQSRRLLKELQPQIIFIKGGFVGVPVGLAAANLHLPYITHDSDAIPGLANRIIARWAAAHAVALPVDAYNYPEGKTFETGIPLQADFQPVTASLKQHYHQELGIPESAKLLFVIGGGLGAKRINEAVAEAVPHLLQEFPDLHVVHGVGRAHEAAMQASYTELLDEAEQGRVQVFGYLKDVYRYSGAADVVITRAGATNLAEFALQGKACIVIPSAVLAGGHQLKNAAYMEHEQAAIVLSETDLAADPNRLAKQVSLLLHDAQRRRKLAEGLARFAKPHATHDLAALILQYATPVEHDETAA